MHETAPEVLVVDDERFYRDQICDALATASIACQTAATGEEALERALAPTLGVVVLDIGLPGLSGIEVLSRLLTERPMLRVIIVSAHTEQEYVLEALRRGACDYLAKPIHEEELVLAVRRAQAGFQIQSRGASLRDRLCALEHQLARLSADDDPMSREQRAADAVAAVLDASKTSLMLLCDAGDELRVVAATGRELSPDEMDRVAVGEGVAGTALAKGEALLIDDLSNDSRFAPTSDADRYRTRSLAVAPLRGVAGPLGVLCATDRRDDAPFGDDDRSLLRILAFGVERALAGPVTDAPVATGGPVDAGSDAELARRVCDALTSEIEPTHLVAAALRAVADTIPAAPVSLYLLGASGDELVLEGQCAGAGYADHSKLPTRRGLTGAVLQTGHLIATDTPAADPRFDAVVDAPEGAPPQSLLCVPVVLRNKTLGVLRVFPEAGVAASARTGEILTAAVSAAVRNVLMYRSLLESVDEVARARREAVAPN